MGTGNFTKAFELYSSDIIFTFCHRYTVVPADCVILYRHRRLPDARLQPARVTVLRWLYRWPLFIPFIVVGQILRTFLAKRVDEQPAH